MSQKNLTTKPFRGIVVLSRCLCSFPGVAAGAILAAILLCGQAFAQTPSVYSNIVFSRIGQPLAGASVAVCLTNPGTTTIGCADLATTYSGVSNDGTTFLTACSGTGGLTYGTNCSNPGLTDGFGNYIIYGATGQFLWAQISGPRITTYVVPFVLGGSGGGGGGSVTNCSTTGGVDFAQTPNVTVTVIPCDAFFTTDGAGNFLAKTGTFNGTGAGYQFFTQGAAPTLAGSNIAYIYAPTSVPTTFGTALPTAPGLSGQPLAIDTVPDATHITTKWSSSLNKRVCMMIFGSDGGSALANTDIGPQLKQCQIPYAATVYEVDIASDAGTPSVIVAKRHCTVAPCNTGANETVSNLVSGALSTNASGATACSKTGATTGLDGFTTCSATLQNTTIAQGDWLETVSATAGGTAKRMSIAIHFTVN